MKNETDLPHFKYIKLYTPNYSVRDMVSFNWWVWRSVVDAEEKISGGVWDGHKTAYEYLSEEITNAIVNNESDAYLTEEYKEYIADIYKDSMYSYIDSHVSNVVKRPMDRVLNVSTGGCHINSDKVYSDLVDLYRYIQQKIKEIDTELGGDYIINSIIVEDTPSITLEYISTNSLYTLI